MPMIAVGGGAISRAELLRIPRTNSVVSVQVAVPHEQARGKIENLIGWAQVPVGIAGPFQVELSSGPREVYVPMATTEGAMVASYSRGMRLLNEGGGARARTVREGLSQHPVLVYDAVDAALRAADVARSSVDRYRLLASEHTQHGSLTAVEPEVLGRRLVLRLLFQTGDAIGINMAAEASERISADLAERTGARERFVHGQDVEKRGGRRRIRAVVVAEDQSASAHGLSSDSGITPGSCGHARGVPGRRRRARGRRPGGAARAPPTRAPACAAPPG